MRTCVFGASAGSEGPDQSVFLLTRPKHGKEIRL